MNGIKDTLPKQNRKIMARLFFCLCSLTLAAIISVQFFEWASSDKQTSSEAPFSAHTPPQPHAVTDVQTTIHAAPVDSPTMDFVVKGIMMADDHQQSVAILAVDGTDLVVSEGSSLPDGEILSEIEATSVILRSQRDTRKIDWEMHGAPLDAQFATLPITDTTDLNPPKEPAFRNPSRPTQIVPVDTRLSELRNIAIQVLRNRFNSKKDVSIAPSSATTSKTP